MMSAGTSEILLHTSFSIAQGERSQNLPVSCPIDELFFRCHLTAGLGMLPKYFYSN